jgi:hypothetical protein
MALAPYTLEQAEQDIADIRGGQDGQEESQTFLDGGTAPNTPDPNGVTLFSAAGSLSYINDNGLTMEVSGGQLATIAPVTVTSAGATTVASLVVPPGDCIPGSTYKLTCFGFGTTGSTGASNVCTCSLSHGGVGGGNAAAGSSLFGISQAFRFWVDAYLVCVTNGVGGTFFSYASWTMTQFGSNILPTSVQAVAIAIGTSSAFVVDSTVQETFRIGFNWAATTGSPTLTVVSGIPQKIA